MKRIQSIRKRTDCPFLNFYEMEVTHRDGSKGPYYMVSRRQTPEALKAVSHDYAPDGVIIYGIMEQTKKLVLIRQYRYPAGTYVYELPAGLIDPGETVQQAAIREFYEETGLTLMPKNSEYCGAPFFTTVGMTDESCSTVFGYCSGTPSSCHQEISEDIEVILADREECRRILREEKVAIMCAYMMMHYISDSDDPLAFLDRINP